MKQQPQTASDLAARLKHATREEFASLERSLAADTRKTVINALNVARRRFAYEEQEVKRLASLYAFDKSFSEGLILGLDEVGRGPLAGPLAVGAVVLKHDSYIAGLNDSKQIPEEKRRVIAQKIKAEALAWTVCYVEPKDIDAWGITQSLRSAFSQAINTIEVANLRFDAILLDGLPLHLDAREHNIIKGDTKSASIAAASIVAKVERDKQMEVYAQNYPVYGFESNKGYASPQHCEALKTYGLCPIHRVSFCHSFLQETLF